MAALLKMNLKHFSLSYDIRVLNIEEYARKFAFRIGMYRHTCTNTIQARVVCGSASPRYTDVSGSRSSKFSP